MPVVVQGDLGATVIAGALDRLIRAEKCKPDCDQCMSGCQEGANQSRGENIRISREGARVDDPFANGRGYFAAG